VVCVRTKPRLRSCPQNANFHHSVAKPVNPANLNGVGDNTQLMHLHEPSLLYNIRFRYAKNLIYTYTGAGARCPHRPSTVQAQATDPTTELAQATS
jgi:hypothetical protein